MNLLKTLIVMVALLFASLSYAITVQDIAGDYDVYVSNFSRGGLAPDTITTEIKVLETGLFMLMCEETIGEDTYNYPCYVDYWSILNNSVIFHYEGMDISCSPYTPNVLGCYVENYQAGLTLIRQSDD